MAHSKIWNPPQFLFVLRSYLIEIHHSSFPTEILLSKAVPYRVSSVALATESVRELRFSFDYCKFLSFLRAALFCTLSGSARLLVIIIFIIEFVHCSFVSSDANIASSFRLISVLPKHLAFGMLSFSSSLKHLYRDVTSFLFVFVKATLLEISPHSSLFRQAPPLEMSDYSLFVFIVAHLLEMSRYSLFRFRRSTSCRVIHYFVFHRST